MDRRTFLRRTTLPAAIAVAGCSAPSGGADERTGDHNDGGTGNSSGSGAADVEGTAPIPRIDDPPAAVYLPGHRKAMRVLDPVTAGEYALVPMLSYPHPFWVVTGTDRQAVEPDAGRGVHLMLVCWDPETGVVFPGDAEPRVTISRNGDRIASRPLWPMLSQEMGVHFGDNVSLPSDGTYTARVDLPPVPTRLTGSLAGRFTEGGTASFEFTYDRAFREEVVDGIELLDRERWGDRGALEPMHHGAGGGPSPEIPYSALPPADAYPGTHLVDPAADADGGSGDGLPESGDATFVVTLLEAGSRLAPGDDRSLLVSPRTPYNRVPLVNTSMRAVVERDGEPVDESRKLERTLDGEFGLWYGRPVADVRTGDTVRITIESPPQAARHQGYETAFFEMEPLELVVP
ncbi:DUF7350 domain-containing protein [Natrinema salaciae]|uniref:DUF7350 domain-containing protein n=1 Tax=Natrinema salaciae TaxID=1186196 RepID=A0A1H9EJD9_9EURY|nr:hypothetical protein [Natrinema salaciae]SEQ25779.1 hypothetical protein SAMN04489841_1310 [Natrinema salaciae]